MQEYLLQRLFCVIFGIVKISSILVVAQNKILETVLILNVHFSKASSLKISCCDSTDSSNNDIL